MDSIRSCDMIKKDIESFYKLIVENKHGRTITPSKERIKSIHNTYIFPWEILLLKTLLSSIVYSIKESWDNTMHSSHKSLLHSTNCLTLIRTKSTNTQPITCLCSPCIACTIPVELNPYYLWILAFQNCAMLMGNPMGVLLYSSSLLIIQLIVNIPLNFVSIGSPLELTCM